MKKYLYLCCILSTAILADDLDLGADFSAGDTISASEFNSKFNMLEKTSRLVKDSDLIGTWNCKSVRFRSTTGYTEYTGGFAYYLDGSITFSQNDTESSLTSPKNWSATARLILDNTTTSGTYSLFANMVGITEISDTSSTGGAIAEVDLTSDDQLRFIWRREGGGYGPQRLILCDK